MCHFILSLGHFFPSPVIPFSKQYQKNHTFTMSETSLPKTFKAAIFAGPNEPLTFEMLELKEPGQGELLIKILATGVCQTDANVQDGTLGNSLSVIGSYHLRM